MITKSPSQYDGKPVGTPTDAVSPWRAGVTTGLDQVERDRAGRVEAKRVRIERRRLGIPAIETDGHWLAHKSRREMAQHWQNLVQKTSRRRKQTWSIAAVAARWGVPKDYVLAELRWLEKRQEMTRRRKRRKKIKAERAARPSATRTQPEKACAYCGRTGVSSGDGHSCDGEQK